MSRTPSDSAVFTTVSFPRGRYWTLSCATCGPCRACNPAAWAARQPWPARSSSMVFVEMSIRGPRPVGARKGCGHDPPFFLTSHHYRYRRRKGGVPLAGPKDNPLGRAGTGGNGERRAQASQAHRAGPAWAPAPETLLIEAKDGLRRAPGPGTRPHPHPLRHRSECGQDSLQTSHADVSEPDRVAVVLEPDMALHPCAVFRPGGELGIGDARLPLVAALLVLEQLDAVQPVFDVRPACHDARLVPLAYRVCHVACGRVEPEVGAGRRQRALTVGVTGIVEHLHLGRGLEDVVRRFGATVEDAAVAAGGDAPLEYQLEVVELVAGHDVAAVVGARDECQGAVTHLPGGRQVGPAVAAPGIQAGSGEQRDPFRCVGGGSGPSTIGRDPLGGGGGRGAR